MDRVSSLLVKDDLTAAFAGRGNISAGAEISGTAAKKKGRDRYFSFPRNFFIYQRILMQF